MSIGTNIKHDDDSELTDREKAKRYLKTWSKKRLIQHHLDLASFNRVEAWAEKYDESK